MKNVLLIILMYASIFADDKKNVSSTTDEEIKQYKIDYSSLKDTLFTTGDYFIEVNLETQMAYLHSRFDSIKTFGVSTGTARVKDGIETKEGVFAIQFKVERWHSVQFDSTLMLHFMTFNWGVGFHALAGKSYYKYLGVKRSSHGCVRVSKEDAKDIYTKVKYGTPVIVHKGNPAVFIGFAEPNDPDLQYLEYPDLKNAVSSRLEKLYKGEYLLRPNAKLLIDNKNVTHAGLPIGDGTKIERRQIIKPDYLFVDSVTPDWKNIDEPIKSSNRYLILAQIEGNVPDQNILLEDILD
ncbi:MAG: murein L,D-transpeptidase [Ignavibacteriales bacterium]|nr:MAG: murein L,D-transpeptidase [Ignavibacteriales bacterium]